VNAKVVGAVTGVGTGGVVVVAAVTNGGFVTVDEHWLDGMHGPVVMVAVFFTLAVSGTDTVAVKVTFTEWPAAKVTWMTNVLEFVAVTATEHESPVATVAHLSVVVFKVRLDGSGSFRTAEPAPVPVFFTVTV
jgi:hypothetical protein